MTTGKKSHEFQAAVAEVLRLVVHSLYTNREIFLRELVSNASDAIDKLRFRAITEPSLLAEGEEPRIRIAADATAGTLTISDDGVGMTEQELVDHLGTIARSGTAELVRQLEEAKKGGDLSLIGRFGVGFYSAFLVADRVEVKSRAAGSEAAHVWSSNGETGFFVEPATRETRGTDVVLHLKADHKEFLEPSRLRELVRRHSEFVAHPIELRVDGESGPSFERLNSSHALWRRTPSEVTEEQYAELYRHLTHDYEAPLLHRHFRVEGTSEFAGILYLPKRAPFDLFAPDTKHGVRLHVRRVLVMESCEELLPRWLRFVRGVVDSEDLPLNVSRETLQDSKVVRTMRKQLVKRVLDALDELSSTEQYADFIRNFGAVLKEGLHFEPEHRDRIAKLVRYESTAGDTLVSLDEYVDRMKPEQQAIYYVVGANRALATSAPHLEALRAKRYEVLVMTDPVDPFAVDGLGEFRGKKLVSAMDADVGASDSTDEDAQKRRDALEPLRARLLTLLGAQVSDVRFTDRLTDSAACLVLPPSGLPPYLERMLRAQQGDAFVSKRVLELNPAHPMIASLGAKVAAGMEDAELGDYARALHDAALLAEGSPLEDPARLVKQLTALLTESLARHAAV